MNYFLFFLGLLISLFVVYDMVYTILSPKGAGFIADYTSRKLWRMILISTGSNAKKKALTFAGPCIILLIVLLWVHLLWLGNTLIVYACPEAIFSSQKDQYVTGFFESTYFVGYVLSSMGNGDYTPGSDAWMWYTGFISFTGVIFISLGISFLLPIIEAVTLKQKVSLQIFMLGQNPKEILDAYKGNDCTYLISELKELEPAVIKLGQYHLAYPVIHYFHSTHTFESLPFNLVVLDEVVTMLLSNTDLLSAKDVFRLKKVRKAMTYYLSTLNNAFIRPGDDEPVRPNKGSLTEEVVADLDTDYYHQETNIYRRKILLAYLQNDGWTWKDMMFNQEEIELRVKQSS
ncbi:potassium channel family protein [Aquimarina sp. ERC-38]|uniref:potassium channel family protein n=1 Tax=Aquimarina sp. ERC-38 TaxID=2949996 RepID=UPI0022470C37|nr:potassium channel family protein [Aquimarina sp. ERC-38]UZO82339.1 potassium channel family protein [Aquimarina sp. ERC-38]